VPAIPVPTIPVPPVPITPVPAAAAAEAGHTGVTDLWDGILGRP
jgi:hypothetical protein